MFYLLLIYVLQNKLSRKDGKIISSKPKFESLAYSTTF